MVGLHSDFLHACQPFGKVADCGEMSGIVVYSRHERTTQEDVRAGRVQPLQVGKDKPVVHASQFAMLPGIGCLDIV